MAKSWVYCPICGESDMRQEDGVIHCDNLSCPSNLEKPQYKYAPLPEVVINDNEARAIRWVNCVEHPHNFSFPIDTYVLFDMIAEIRYHRSKEK